MVRRGWLVAALVLAVVAGVAGGASAELVFPTDPQSTAIEPGGFYFGVAAQGLIVSLPRFDWIEKGQDEDGPYKFSLARHPQVIGGGPIGTVGYALPAGAVPGWIGARPRVEASVNYFRGEGHNKENTKINFMHIASVDGQSGYANDDHLDTRTDLKTTMESTHGAVPFRTDHDLSPNLTLSPLIGLIGGYTLTTFRAHTRFTDILEAREDVVGTLKEQIKMSRVGAQIGADVRWRINNMLAVHTGVVGMVFHQRSEFAARDCLSEESPQNTVEQCDGAGFATTAHATDTRVAGRAVANAGISYSMGWGELSLTTIGAYDTHAPGVRNPTLEGDTGSRSATLRFTGEWSAGGMVLLRIPLN